MFGSDIFEEQDDRTQEQFTFEPFAKMPGSFYVGSAERFVDRTLAKIESGDDLVFATSYPRRLAAVTDKLGFALGRTVEFLGGVEGAQADREDIDAIFELKETGNSITDNDIVVIENSIGSIELGAIWRAEL